MKHTLASRLIPALLTVTLSGGGCAHATYTLEATTLATSPPEVIAVLPVELHHSHDDFEAFVRTRDLVRTVIAHGRFDVLGPEEIVMLPKHMEPELLLSRSTLADDAGRAGYTTEGLVVLHVVAERALQESKRLLVVAGESGKVEIGSTRYVRARLDVRVELWHPASGTLLARAHASAEEDMLASAATADPSPHLTALIRDLTMKALNVLRPGRDGTAPGSRGVMPFDGIENPYALGGLDVDISYLASDPTERLMRDARTLERLRASDPGVGAAAAAALVASPRGILVTHAVHPFFPGDYLLEVDGSAAGLPSVWRAWNRARPGDPIGVKLVRDGEKMAMRVSR